MSENVLIFGKDAWPYTRAAREAFAKEGRQVDYYNVVKDARHFETMLKHSNGTRKVPVIVEGQTVTIGFDGGTWGVWRFGWKPIGMSNVECQMSNDELRKLLESIFERLKYGFLFNYDYLLLDRSAGGGPQFVIFQSSFFISIFPFPEG